MAAVWGLNVGLAMDASKPFRVLVCEVWTGVLCRPDGVRWRRDIDGEAEKYVSFPTHQEAVDFIRISCETRPHLECHLYKGEQRLGEFRPTEPAR